MKQPTTDAYGTSEFQGSLPTDTRYITQSLWTLTLSRPTSYYTLRPELSPRYQNPRRAIGLDPEFTLANSDLCI